MTETHPSPVALVPGVAYETCVLQLNPTAESLRVAVCTLWRQPAVEAERHDACIVGPLYSTRGVGLMLRTLLANATIERLCVMGPDLSGTYEVVHALWTGSQSISGNLQLFLDNLGLSDVPLAEVVDLLAHVALWRDGLEVVPRRSQEVRGARLYPAPPPPVVDKAFRGDPGVRVLGDTAAHVWPRLLDQVMGHGAVSSTSYGTHQQEVLALQWVIRKPLASLAAVPAFMGFSREQGSAYFIEQLLSPRVPEGVAYTYGAQMRTPVDQYQLAIDTLRDNPEQRRVYLSTWRPDSMKASSPPCLTGIWLRREEGGALGMWAVFRSHDIFQAWPKNIYGLCCLLDWFAEQLGLEVGTLSGISLSAHVYSGNWSEARDVSVRGRGRIEWDARSNFNITRAPAELAGSASLPHLPDKVVSLTRSDAVPQELVVEKNDFADFRTGPALRVERLSPAGDQVLKVYEGTPEQILRDVEADGAITTVGHALWFAGELYRSAR